MKLGVFSRTFARANLDQVLVAIRQHDLSVVQFNLSSAGLESLPAELADYVCRRIHEAFRRHDVQMAAVSGTFNAVHPDPLKRQTGIDRCKKLITSCHKLGTNIVSLCSGTRDATDMWRYHPENTLPGVRDDLVATLEELLPVAELHGVTLGIEPEIGNVINSAQSARRLLDDIQSSRLKIIFDGANIIQEGDHSSMRAILEEGFALLEEDIVLVHAKERSNHEHPTPLPVGSGRLDWGTYFRLLRAMKFEAPLILHGVPEDAVSQSLAFLHAGLAHRIADNETGESQANQTL